MNFNVLRYIIAVAEERNFTAAAKKMYISQPSLSQSIRALETQLGVSLVDRSSSPLELTRAGELYVRWARQTLRMQQEVQKQISDIADGSDTMLSVGASAERTRYLLPPVIRQFLESRPHCSIKIWDVPTAQLCPLLDEDKIDLSIGFPEQDTIRYTSEPICEERLLLAVPSNIHLPLPETTARQFPPVELKLFRDVPFISLQTEQALGHTLTQYCAQCGFIPNIRLECRILSNLHDMVAAGAGVGLVTEASALRYGNDNTQVRYYSLAEFPAIQQIAAVYRNDRYLSQDANALITLLQAQAKVSALPKVAY